ncbi:MAG: exosortase X [Bacteroidia bacterium]
MNLRLNLKGPERKLLRFLLFFILIYLGWYIIYELFIHPWGKLDMLVINDTVAHTQQLLHLFGYDVFVSNNETVRTVGIDGTHGLWIGDPCNGLTLFALFLSFIVAFPGAWKHKAWFIPTGILLIHLLNIIRVTCLCMIVKYNPTWLEFNHTYLFQLLMYGFIFLLWMIWIKRYSGLQMRKSSAA